MKKTSRIMLLSFTLVGLLFAVGMTAVAETLTIQWIINDQAYNYLMKDFIPRFERQHGVTVQIERVNWGNRMDKIVINTAAGNPPDIFFSGAEQIKELVEAGLLHPIDDYIAAMPDKDDFFPPSWGSSTFQGHHYGVPLYSSPRVFWYRADLFELAGLDPSRPPTSWDELLEYARRLTVTDGTVVIQQGIDLERWTGSNPMSNLQEFYMYLAQNGGRLFDPDTYEAEFAGPLGVEALNFMSDLRDAVQPPGYTLNNGGGTGNRIFRGISAMRVDTSSVIRDFYNPALNLSLADEMRAMVPPPGHKEHITVVYSDWLGIHAQSKNKEVAWEFLKALTAPDVLRDFNLAAGYQSPRRSTYTDFVNDQPMVQFVYQSLSYSVPFPIFGSPTQAMNAFNERYMAVIGRREASQSALAEAARIWNLTVN